MPHGAFWISIPEGFAAAKSGMGTDRKASLIYMTVTIYSLLENANQTRIPESQLPVACKIGVDDERPNDGNCSVKSNSGLECQ
jgi:hypothetical protein